MSDATPLDAAYRERAHLVAHLARTHDAHWAVDDAEPDWPVICIHTSAGQLAWHVGPADVSLFPSHLPTRPSDWDGHTTEEKYERLGQLGTWRPDVRGWRERRRARKSCTHPEVAEVGWIVDLGRHKIFECGLCGRRKVV